MPRPVTHRAAVAVAALVLSAAASAACVRVAATPLGAAPYPAVPADSVRVFATLSPRAYTEIAVLRVSRAFRGDAAALRALRTHAGRLGADGLLLLNTRTGAPVPTDVSGVLVGSEGAGGVFVGRASGNGDDFERAVAIRITPVESR